MNVDCNDPNIMILCTNFLPQELLTRNEETIGRVYTLMNTSPTFVGLAIGFWSSYTALVNFWSMQEKF